MSPRSGIPSVKTTHSDSSPTTQTHEEEVPFSSSAPLVSWYPSFSLHFPPSHLPSVRHLYPICFCTLPPCFCLPAFLSALEFNSGKRQLQVYYRQPARRGCLSNLSPPIPNCCCRITFGGWKTTVHTCNACKDADRLNFKKGVN